MADFHMKENPVCSEVELFEDDGKWNDEDEGRLVIRASGGQLDWVLTEEEEIKLAKYLYSKHCKAGEAWGGV